MSGTKQGQQWQRERGQRSTVIAEQLRQSELCGCFYGLAVFPPARVSEWIDDVLELRCTGPKLFGHPLPPHVRAVERYFASIREHSSLKGKRHHVRLSATRELVAVVGRRRGVPHVLEVDARGMTAVGHVFYRSEKGVWLTDHFPAPDKTTLQSIK